MLQDNETVTPFTSSVADQVQSYVSTLKIYESLISTIPAIIFALVLGPWSEKNGRKPLMIVPTVGFLLSSFFYMFVDSFTWSAEFLLLAGIPASLLGGWSTFNLAINSYISDVTTEDTRTSSISLFMGIAMTAGPVGNFLGGHIYHYGGHLAIWLSSIVCILLSLVYLIFCVAESRSKVPIIIISPDTAAETSKRFEFIEHLVLIFTNLWSCFTVTFRPRPGYRRTIICLLLIMMCILIFSDCKYHIFNKSLNHLKKKYFYQLRLVLRSFTPERSLDGTF